MGKATTEDVRGEAGTTMDSGRLSRAGQGHPEAPCRSDKE